VGAHRIPRAHTLHARSPHPPPQYLPGQVPASRCSAHFSIHSAGQMDRYARAYTAHLSSSPSLSFMHLKYML